MSADASLDLRAFPELSRWMLDLALVKPSCSAQAVTVTVHWTASRVGVTSNLTQSRRDYALLRVYS
jgi:hypothetical protein